MQWEGLGFQSRHALLLAEMQSKGLEPICFDSGRSAVRGLGVQSEHLVLLLAEMQRDGLDPNDFTVLPLAEMQ